MAVITFPKILTERLTDEGARALADMFNTVENSAQKATLEIAEERFEKRLAQAEARLETKIAESKAELKAEIATTNIKIAESKAEVIKWMFIFWAGQIGILFAFFKH